MNAQKTFYDVQQVEYSAMNALMSNVYTRAVERGKKI
jgi:hypothetical protein